MQCTALVYPRNRRVGSPLDCGARQWNLHAAHVSPRPSLRQTLTLLGIPSPRRVRHCLESSTVVLPAHRHTGASGREGVGEGPVAVDRDRCCSQPPTSTRHEPRSSQDGHAHTQYTHVSSDYTE